MELRIPKFDDKLNLKLVILAAQRSISKQELIVELLREAMKAVK